MANAVWLLMALPFWYLVACLALAAPLAAGLFSLIPAAGTVSLGIGLFLAKRQWQREFLLFLGPFVLSEVLVAVAGLMRGQIREGQASPVLAHIVSGGLLIFIAVQIAASVYLIYRLKAARSAAVALAIFSVTYATFAAFVAGMSFSDSWL